MNAQRQTAVVTGASSGIGKVTALRLAGKGINVIAAARRLERLIDMAEQNRNITPQKVDLADPADVESFCSYIAGLQQPVSILINNAGYSSRGVLEDVSLEKIKRLFEVNLFSLMRVTQACVPGMRRMRAGVIVNLSSIVGKFPFPGSGVYASSKFAVEGITDALRIELAPFGIKVVTIRPGAIATEFGEIAEKMTGDLLARTDQDYKLFYQTVKAAMAKIFVNRSASSPELIADLIEEAVFADKPRAVYAAGALSNEFLARRADLDDDRFYRFMLEKFDLTG
ncbi:MAG: SDR family NAD(P)-dependent oxidoreductase, partial [Desulfobacterales bacterium]